MKRSLAMFFAALGMFLVAGCYLFVGRTQSLPAPTVDRVGFPTGYQQTFTKVFTFDNYQSRAVLVMWANPAATGVRANTVNKFPYGSIIVMETWPATLDAN